MSPERSDLDLLADIEEAARRIGTYTAGMTYDGFLGNLETQDAVIRNLEIIGEATKNLSAELRAAQPDIPWKGMAGLRDRLIHDYFGVNLDIVWQIAAVDLPELTAQIGAMRHGDLGD
jgi:uncharacterized protein with HEPN domain